MNDLEKQLQEAAANHDGEKIRRLVGMAAGQDGGESTRRRLAAILEKAGADAAAVQFIFSNIDSMLNVKSNDANLCAAIMRGDTEAVRLLLASGGADIHAADRFLQYSALTLAAAEGHVPILNMLIGAGAVVNATDASGKTALMHAAQAGKTAAAACLLEHKANTEITAPPSDWTALLFAAAHGRTDCARLLLEKGANISARAYNDCDALQLAAEYGHTEMLAFLLQQGMDIKAHDADGLSVLHAAVAGGHADATRFLIEHGADIHAVDNDGGTPILLAITMGAIGNTENTVEILRLLHEGGADADTTSKDGDTTLMRASVFCPACIPLLLEYGVSVNAANKYGITALMGAADAKKLHAVQLLLEHGADANAACPSSAGETALFFAVRQNHTDIARALLEHDADPNARNKRGTTPLMLAAKSGDADMARLLLDHGADVHAADAKGKTALAHTPKKKHSDIVQMLREAGAQG
ncbi:MAG: ankyrin repeat domain-containing protein [Ottowia sp.]|nr:ankyrin repeat domain-containing protein [Ottowia sp.]